MLLLEYSNIYWKDSPLKFLLLLGLVQHFSKNGAYVHKIKAYWHSSCIEHQSLAAWIDSIMHLHGILDIATCVYWILNGIVEMPKCIRCGKQLSAKKFDATKTSLPCYCSRTCMNMSSLHAAHANATKKSRAEDDKDFWAKVELKKKHTKAKHGHSLNWNNSAKRLSTVKQKSIDDPLYFSKIEQKRKCTKVANGHSQGWHNEKQMVSTRRKRNSGKWESLHTIESREQTSISRYGFKSPNSSPIVKQHKKEGCIKRYGIDSYSKTEMYHLQMAACNEQRKAKEHKTKMKNGTFSISKPEERVYDWLCAKFGKDNVIRLYKSDAYPFNCDFYIKSIDTYIECNFSWTHGGHFFNPLDKDDIAKLEKWKSKKTKYYDNAILTWTTRDAKKRECAKKNRLKYYAMWTEDYAELKKYLVVCTKSML